MTNNLISAKMVKILWYLKNKFTNKYVKSSCDLCKYGGISMFWTITFNE